MEQSSEGTIRLMLTLKEFAELLFKELESIDTDHIKVSDILMAIINIGKKLNKEKK
jgi:hypothetical protein